MEALVLLLTVSNICTWIFLGIRYKRNSNIEKITYTLWVGVEQLIESIENNVDKYNRIRLDAIKGKLDTLKFYSKKVDKTLTK